MPKADRSEDPRIVVEGMEHIIQRDLEKHRSLVERTRSELEAYLGARAHEIARKKHYRRLIGGGEYDDDALRTSCDQMAVNVRQMSDKVDAAREKLKFETNIVDTLTAQLADQMEGLRLLAEHGGNALSD